MTKALIFSLALILLIQITKSSAFAAVNPGEGGTSASASSQSQVIAETKTENCSGIFGAISCLFQDLLNKLNPQSLSLTDVNLSRLFSIQKAALSGTNSSDFNGSIPRLLTPDQKSGDDPRTALIQTESQKIKGEIVLNKDGGGTVNLAGGGTYTVTQNTVPANFGEIAPINDKFGFLREAIDPATLRGDYTFTLPTGGPGSESQPGKIELTDKTPKSIQWDVQRQTTIAGTPDASNPNCPNYSGPPPAQKPSGQCTASGSATFAASGPLYTATKVDEAAKAGENLSTVSSLFLSPGTKFKKGDTTKDISYQVAYKPLLGGSNQTSSSEVPLQNLGGAVGAYDCLTRQIFFTPGNGATGLCDKTVVEAPSVQGAETSNQPLVSNQLPVVGFWGSIGQTIGKALGWILSL